MIKTIFYIVLLEITFDPGISSKDLIERCGIQDRTLHNYLEKLKKEGLVKSRAKISIDVDFRRTNYWPTKTIEQIIALYPELKEAMFKAKIRTSRELPNKLEKLIETLELLKSK